MISYKLRCGGGCPKKFKKNAKSVGKTESERDSNIQKLKQINFHFNDVFSNEHIN